MSGGKLTGDARQRVGEVRVEAMAVRERGEAGRESKRNKPAQEMGGVELVLAFSAVPPRPVAFLEIEHATPRVSASWVRRIMWLRTGLRIRRRKGTGTQQKADVLINRAVFEHERDGDDADDADDDDDDDRQHRLPPYFSSSSRPRMDSALSRQTHPQQTTWSYCAFPTSHMSCDGRRRSGKDRLASVHGAIPRGGVLSRGSPLLDGRLQWVGSREAKSPNPSPSTFVPKSIPSHPIPAINLLGHKPSTPALPVDRAGLKAASRVGSGRVGSAGLKANFMVNASAICEVEPTVGTPQARGGHVIPLRVLGVLLGFFDGVAENVEQATYTNGGGNPPVNMPGQSSSSPRTRSLKLFPLFPL
ncbi:hypothetical protein JHW43_002137 [Diplocarpon mali]|nr:hypothetical protein JHW43_002137 [Diplocarpon mali]